MAIGQELRIDIETLGPADFMLVADKLRKNSRAGLSVSFCKFAALCALKLDHEFLKDEAISYADLLVESSSGSPHSCLVRGSIKWVLGRFEEAISDVERAISKATEPGQEELLRKGKNNFIYFVADWKLCAQADRPHWHAQADQYVQELTGNGVDGNEADTIGTYRIAFGTTAEDIEEGRRLIRHSLATRSGDLDTYTHSYRLHEFAALNRLLKLA